MTFRQNAWYLSKLLSMSDHITLSNITTIATNIPSNILPRIELNIVCFEVNSNYITMSFTLILNEDELDNSALTTLHYFKWKKAFSKTFSVHDITLYLFCCHRLSTAKYSKVIWKIENNPIASWHASLKYNNNKWFIINSLVSLVKWYKQIWSRTLSIVSIN